MALCCTHLASHLIEDNNKFSIYAPVIMNSELIVYKGESANIKTVGVGQQRQYLQNLAEKSHPKLDNFQEIKTSMLPYSLSTGLIDAAILDVTKLTPLTEFQFMPLSNTDYISYVLVVSNDITNTQAFSQFMKSYNTTVEKLNSQQNFDTNQQFYKIAGTKFLVLD